MTILIVIGAFDLLALIPSIIVDIKRKKFHWSKWVIITFISVLILFFIMNFIVPLIFMPPITEDAWPILVSPTPRSNL
ncbi:MAG: hypothetical protein M1450_04945 [Patescibacteria group bacterium]|nr:hypothetical protein [Patescibacteria group bacterium]